jgi:thiol-disulfide isomerase/thioredoxin
VYSRYAALLLLLVLGSAAIQAQKAQRPPASNTAAKVGQPPAPGDPGYVPEDPKLARLLNLPGPAITLRTIDGRTIDLAKIYGKKPIYLKLWATYCIPCRVQMPGFEKIYDTFGDRMEVVSINAGVGDDAEKVRAFVAANKGRIPVAIDDGSLGAWLKMEATPLHLLIGRNGRIAFAGHQDGPTLDTAILKVLADAAPGTPVETTKVESVTALKPGDRVPAIDLRRADDTPVRLAAGVTSRPRAVVFMATWCESYLKEIEPETVARCRQIREEVDRLSQAGTVEWLGVATHLWTDTKGLGSYQARMKPRLPLALDSTGQAFRTFGIRRLPAVALIAADGRLVRVVGPDDPALAAAVEELARRK